MFSTALLRRRWLGLNHLLEECALTHLAKGGFRILYFLTADQAHGPFFFLAYVGKLLTDKYTRPFGIALETGANGFLICFALAPRLSTTARHAACNHRIGFEDAVCTICVGPDNHHEASALVSTRAAAGH
jgi:hypothetical protein